MKKNKNILIVLNYYYPYISGLSEYARLSAENLVKDGYNVTVVTTNHNNSKDKEVVNGVLVYRSRILFKLGKGVISLDFIFKSIIFARTADKVNMHLPMLESGLLSLFIPKQKLITMYHCDINLSQSLLDRMITKVMDLSHWIALQRSKTVNVTNEDYALHCRLSGVLNPKLNVVGVPIKEYKYVEINRDDKYRTIGFLGRIVEEKGIDILIKAFEILIQKYSDVKLMIAGDYLSVAGGSIFPRLQAYIDEHSIRNIQFIGKIKEADMEAFFSSLDVFVLPSINSLEAFGLVQLEAMRCGVPVVASNLYGVRTIIQQTGGGVICKAGDVLSLVESLEEVLNHKHKYVRSIQEIEAFYSNEKWKESLIESLEN